MARWLTWALLLPLGGVLAAAELHLSRIGETPDFVTLTGPSPTTPPLRSGSFDAASARHLGAYGHALSDVNRTALVDGKQGRDISRACAGNSHASA